MKTIDFSATNAACDYIDLISRFKTCSDCQACFQIYIGAVWTLYVHMSYGWELDEQMFATPR